MTEPEVGPAVEKLIALSEYRVAAHVREGRHVKSYLRGGGSGEHTLKTPGSLKALAAIKSDHGEWSIPSGSQPTDPVTGPTVDWEQPGGWEYKKMNGSSLKQINYLADNGWELVSSSPGAKAIPGVPGLAASYRPATTIFRRKKGTKDKPVDPFGKPRTMDELKAMQKERQKGMGWREKLIDSMTGGRSTKRKHRG